MHSPGVIHRMSKPMPRVEPQVFDGMCATAVPIQKLAVKRLEWMDKALDDFAQGGAMAAAEVRTDRGDRTMLDRIRENFVGAFYPWRMRFD